MYQKEEGGYFLRKTLCSKGILVLIQFWRLTEVLEKYSLDIAI